MTVMTTQVPSFLPHGREFTRAIDQEVFEGAAPFPVTSTPASLID